MRSKRIWIPALLLALLAAASLGITVWLGLCSNPSVGLAGAGFAGLDAYLALFSGDGLTAIIQSAVLRLATVVAGGLVGFGVGLAASRIQSRYVRGVVCALLLLPAFVPATIWGALFRPVAENARRVLAGAIPVFSLTGAAGMLFELRRNRYTGMLAVALLSLGAIFSTDAPLDLSVSSTAVTLHTLIDGKTTAQAYAAAGLKMCAECLLTAVAAFTVTRLIPRPEETEPMRPARDAKAGGACALAFGTLLLCCCVALIPLMVNVFSGTVALSALPDGALRNSLISALFALVITFGGVLGVLTLSEGGSRPLRALILTALPLLLSLTPLKYALITRFAQGTLVPAVLSAVLNPVSAMLLALFLLLGAGSVRVRLLASGAAALCAAACAAGSAYPGLVYGIPTLGEVVDRSADVSGFAYLMPAVLLMGCVGAALFSGVFAFSDRTRGQQRQSVTPKQGLTLKGGEIEEAHEADARAYFKSNQKSPSQDTRPTVHVAALENKEPAPMTSEESISAHAVPAASGYTAQFLKTAEPDREAPPALSRTLPLNDPEPAPYEAPAAPQPTEKTPEPEFDPAAPSPAQLISLINALTRMRSLGIVTDREYREKKDALMKMF